MRVCGYPMNTPMQINLPSLQKSINILYYIDIDHNMDGFKHYECYFNAVL